MASNDPQPPPPPPITLPPVVDVDRIAEGGLSETPRFLRTDLVSALRADASALYRAGAFVKGGLRPHHDNHKKATAPKKSKTKKPKTETKKTKTDENTRLCDVCGLFDDAENVEHNEKVGDRDAREELFDVVADLRGMLMEELGVDLSENMELQYLRYPGRDGGGGGGDGAKKKKKEGFYRRHFDHTGDDDKPHRRKVSLLLYLNEEGWDAEADGGVLRAYLRHTKKGKDDDDRPCAAAAEAISERNVVPEGGKLVLFDSTTVEHEVLPTRRERWAVVGWYLIDKETKKCKATACGGKGGGSKRSHRAGNEEVEFSKNKRRRRKKGRRRGR